MANEKHVSVLFPVGRLIQGSLYVPNTKDMAGNPLTIKNPKSASFGQPRVDYYIGIAIPKTPGCTHWSQETSPNPRVGAWGKKIWDAAHSFWGDLASNKKDFSWKIVDGDSTDYDGGNPPKRQCDKPNYKGHWIVNMGSGLAPKIVNSDGSAYILEKDAVKRGYYIQVNATLSSNSSPMNQGIYINHNAVSFQYPGEEIVSGIDPASLGFGGNPVPTGAVVVAPPVAPPAPVAARPPMPPITPNHAFVQQAGLPPAAPPAPRMLNNGATFDSYIAAGWTETQLSEQGLL